MLRLTVVPSQRAVLLLHNIAQDTQAETMLVSPDNQTQQQPEILRLAIP
jgi:hypothetical protein